MKVYCKACHTALTPDLRYLPYASLTNEEDDRPFLPQGYYWISDGKCFANTGGRVVIHIDDLINTMRHSDPERLQGCCGVSGCYGPNRICMQKHEVASEYSDCWMPHAIIFEKNAVYTIDY
ncbi:hypothetical protein [Xanthocytophaga agilis]|uniref:Uncharacterized protein n=1 Tax=Xanthocytophaga agilis TaxID=3048010 RepID=A0AAE3R9W3_9BACT|nr:hypothetical protein [Xanthocytophaga agilis]MDJ1506354.1 hypothetical protein [Xanthocytophaga agilis]